MNFTTLATISAAILSLLGLGWLFKGELMLRRWRLETSATALLVGRRIGVIYLGVAVLMAMVRNIPAGEGQVGVSLGAAAFAIGLAVIGTWEYARGRVGPAILVSVAVEILLAAGFGAIGWR